MVEVPDDEILQAFENVASDLLALEEPGEAQGIHIDSAKDAVFHQLGVPYSKEAFGRIEAVLTEHYHPVDQYIRY